MSGRPLTRAIAVREASLAGELTAIVDGRQVMRPTPIQAVDKVLVRLEMAWEEACAAPDRIRALAMLKAIESFARYTGVEMAAQLLNSRSPIGETWQERLKQAGWQPPAATEVLPGLPRPDGEVDLEGATVIDLEVTK